MTELWAEVKDGYIAGDRDGLVSLRDALNDALGGNGNHFTFDDQEGVQHVIFIERVGP